MDIFFKQVISRRLNAVSLDERDLPADVPMNLDGRVPGRKVMCYDDDRVLENARACF